MCKLPAARVLALLLAAAAGHAIANPTVLYDQGDYGIGTGPEAAQLLPVNDFVLAAPAAITGFSVWMRDGSAAFGGGDGLDDGSFRSFSGALSWYFFADAAGAPGALVAAGVALAPTVVDTGDDTVLDDEDIFEVSVTLPAELVLGAGRGWLGVREGAAGAAYDGTSITWMGSLAAQGAGRYAFFDGAAMADLQGPFAIDAAFQLIGRTVPEPAPLALLAAAGLAAVVRRPRGRVRDTGSAARASGAAAR